MNLLKISPIITMCLYYRHIESSDKELSPKTLSLLKKKVMKQKKNPGNYTIDIRIFKSCLINVLSGSKSTLIRH